MKNIIPMIMLAATLAACSNPAETPVNTRPAEQPAGQVQETRVPAPDAATLSPELASQPSFDSLGSGWERIFPGAPTICAHGGEYAFWARQGASDNLLVYFEGGGGCW